MPTKPKRKYVQITAWVTQAEKDLFLKIAKTYNRSVSGELRMLILLHIQNNGDLLEIFHEK